jgi:hypothetical protein
MYRYLWLGLAAVSLSGCFNSERQPGQGEIFASKQELDAKDDAICRGYGATPGSPVYIQCRVSQDTRRDNFKHD